MERKAFLGCSHKRPTLDLQIFGHDLGSNDSLRGGRGLDGSVLMRKFKKNKNFLKNQNSRGLAVNFPNLGILYKNTKIDITWVKANIAKWLRARWKRIDKTILKCYEILTTFKNIRKYTKQRHYKINQIDVNLRIFLLAELCLSVMNRFFISRLRSQGNLLVSVLPSLLSDRPLSIHQVLNLQLSRMSVDGYASL